MLTYEEANALNSRLLAECEDSDPWRVPSMTATETLDPRDAQA